MTSTPSTSLTRAVALLLRVVTLWMVMVGVALPAADAAAPRNLAGLDALATSAWAAPHEGTCPLRTDASGPVAEAPGKGLPPVQEPGGAMEEQRRTEEVEGDALADAGAHPEALTSLTLALPAPMIARAYDLDALVSVAPPPPDAAHDGLTLYQRHSRDAHGARGPPRA